LPLCFNKLHIQKMYGEVEIWHSAFLTYSLYRDEWRSCLARFNPRDRSHDALSWTGTKDDLDNVEKIELWTYWESNPNSLVFKPVAYSLDVVLRELKNNVYNTQM